MGSAYLAWHAWMTGCVDLCQTVGFPTREISPNQEAAKLAHPLAHEATPFSLQIWIFTPPSTVLGS